MSITSKAKNGFVFSFDLLFAFILVCFIAFLLLANASALLNERKIGNKQLFLEEKGILIIDSMVKNRNFEEPLLGSAVFDEEKHRVLSNVLDEKMLERLKAKEIAGVKVVKAWLKEKSESGVKERILFENFNGMEKECRSFERFVIVNGESKMIGAVFCSAQ